MENKTIAIDWLAGIRVVVIGHYVPGPLAAYLLRMLGAEVIKVEQDKGDYLRMMGRVGTGEHATSPLFRMLNGGFKSLGLQWRTPEGAAVLRELLDKADVVIDGGRAGVLERTLGIAPERLGNGLVYVPITAYGQVGPMAGLAGHDNNILALAGNLSYTQTSAEGMPTVFSAPVADIFAGQMAAFGAVAALLGRQRLKDKGQKLDVSMLHAGFFLNLLEVAARIGQGYRPPQAGKGWMNGGRPDYRPYLCRDGKAIFFGPLEPWTLQRFLEGVERKDLLGLAATPEALGSGLREMFLQRNRDEWVELGIRLDACLTAVNSLEEAVKEPQIQSLGLVQQFQDTRLGPLELPSYPMGFGPESQQPTLADTAPNLGEHTQALLTELLGMSEARINELRQKNIVQ